MLSTLGLVVLLSRQFYEAIATWPHQDRGLPAKRVRKPSDCPAPCLASKLVINSPLLMAWDAMTVPVDRTALGREQSFHLFIGAARACMPDALRRLDVWEGSKHSIKEGSFIAWQSAARVKGPDWRLGILWEDAAYSESKGRTLTITIMNERRPL